MTLGKRPAGWSGRLVGGHTNIQREPPRRLSASPRIRPDATGISTFPPQERKCRPGPGHRTRANWRLHRWRPRLLPAPLGSRGRSDVAGVRHLADGRWPFVPDGEIRPLLPERWKVARRHRVGPRVTPPSLELARVEALPIREILQERVNRPEPVVPTLALLYSHGLRPAHRVPGPVQPQAAALGSGGLHW